MDSIRNRILYRSDVWDFDRRITGCKPRLIYIFATKWTIQWINRVRLNMIPMINIRATGERIKTLMDERGLVVKDIQSELGLGTVQAVYKWFYGQNLPSLDNLIVLSHVFQVKIDDILVLEERG